MSELFTIMWHLMWYSGGTFAVGVAIAYTFQLLDANDKLKDDSEKAKKKATATKCKAEKDANALKHDLNKSHDDLDRAKESNAHLSTEICLAQRQLILAEESNEHLLLTNANYRRARQAIKAKYDANHKELIANQQARQRELEASEKQARERTAQQSRDYISQHIKDRHEREDRAKHARQQKELELKLECETNTRKLAESQKSIQESLFDNERRQLKTAKTTELLKQELLLTKGVQANCIICFEDKYDKNGIYCCPSVQFSSGLEQKPHFVCRECLSDLVKHDTSIESGIGMMGNGKLFCPMHCRECPTPRCQHTREKEHLCQSPAYEDKLLAGALPEKDFNHYKEACLKLAENKLRLQINHEAEQRVQKVRLEFMHQTLNERICSLAIGYIYNEILTTCCPNPNGCKQAYFDFAGCCALECSRCKHYFCAWCLEYCGDGTTGNKGHRHVNACSWKPPGVDAYYPRPIKTFHDFDCKRRADEVKRFLQAESIVNPGPQNGTGRNAAIDSMLQNLNCPKPEDWKTLRKLVARQMEGRSKDDAWVLDAVRSIVPASEALADGVLAPWREDSNVESDEFIHNRKWECRFCTFRNAHHFRHCEICENAR